jgi:CubicO group peptidase (beta-lactamase class C family)
MYWGEWWRWHQGCRFDKFLEKRIFKPLKMKDTGFYVPAEKVNRFAANYNYRKGKLTMIDDPKTSSYLGESGFQIWRGWAVLDCDRLHAVSPDD